MLVVSIKKSKFFLIQYLFSPLFCFQKNPIKFLVHYTPVVILRCFSQNLLARVSDELKWPTERAFLSSSSTSMRENFTYSEWEKVQTMSPSSLWRTNFVYIHQKYIACVISSIHGVNFKKFFECREVSDFFCHTFGQIHPFN